MRRIPRLRIPAGPRRALSYPLITPATTRASLLPPAAPRGLRFYAAQPEVREKLPRSLSQGNESDASTIPGELVPYAEPERFTGYQNRSFQPPAPRSEALRGEEVTDPEYVPATLAHELELVGGVRDWWGNRKNWSEKQNFRGFSARRVCDQTAEKNVYAVVRRAVVEALALKQLGKEKQFLRSWAIGGIAAQKRVAEIKIERSGNPGEVTLSGNVEAVVKGLVEPKAKSKAPSCSMDAIGMTRLPLRISLADWRLKFAVTKRIFQLTGRLIPDHKLADVEDSDDLTRMLLTPPKPKTLTAAMTKEVKVKVPRTQNMTLIAPNLLFKPKRMTRGDKDRRLGRWKLIDKELRKRGLQFNPTSPDALPLSKPVTKERQWLRGHA